MNEWDWPQVILVLGVLFLLLAAIAGAVSFGFESRKLSIKSARVDEMRQLVDRYEQLVAKTLEAEQRTATDVAELRARTASIELILRTVE
jgi:hypothetical protein